jgi:uncharacterized membrane protein
MKKKILKSIAISSVLLGSILTACLAEAQVRAVGTLSGKRAGSSAGQATARSLITPGTPSYTYTLLSYPGQLITVAISINKGATTSKTEVVGGYGTGYGEYEAGFVARVSGTKTVAESYRSVVYPGESGADQYITSINDSGQIVGWYSGIPGRVVGYERSGGEFSPLNVPFPGATGTYPEYINNSGEIVGQWTDSDGNAHAFTLIGGAFTSFDYPGGTQTEFDYVNSAGDITGSCYDSSGVGIGFLFSGGTYTPIEYPGAVETLAGGINDSGVVVGSYCTTSECPVNFHGLQSFLWSGGVFTDISILPGEVYAEAADINNNGVLAGYYLDAAGLYVGFIATPDK